MHAFSACHLPLPLLRSGPTSRLFLGNLQERILLFSVQAKDIGLTNSNIPDIYIHIYCHVQLVVCNSTFHSHPHYCGVRCFVSFQGAHGVAHLSPAQRTGTESRIFEPKIYPAWYSPTACNAPSSIHIDRNTLINKRHINSDSCYDIRRS